MPKDTKKIIVPRGKYILVRQDEPEERKSEAGLLTPDSDEQEQRAQGIVEAVGSEIKDIKKGDKVIFGAYAGETMKIKESGKEIDYKLLYDEDVIAFIK